LQIKGDSNKKKKKMKTNDVDKIFFWSKPLDTLSQVYIYRKIMKISAALESWQPS
jgi:hypothetical protein